MDSQRKFIGSILGVALLLAIFSGAASGVIAAVVTNQSLQSYIESLSRGTGLVQISQVKPQPLPGTYEEALERVQESGWRSVVFITPISKDSKVSRDWLKIDDAAGVGIVITSDGWILTRQGELTDFRVVEDEAEVWLRQKRYDIQKVVKDDLTDLVMIKVEANDLPAIAFGSADSLKGGEMVFALSGSNEVAVSSLLSANKTIDGTIFPAEKYSTQWLLFDAARGPLMNSTGELIGFADGVQALPLNHALSFVQSVLRSGDASHAAIGATVVDLSSFLNIDPVLTQNQKVGALIFASGRNKAVLSKSPAETSGLRSGDIILSIDGTLISDTVELSEIINTYSVGDTVNIKIIREGSEQELSITFANFADLVY